MFCREDKTLPPIPALLEPLAQQHVIVLNGQDESLDQEQEMALYDFVQQGGGLICLGSAIQRYRESELLGKLLGPLHGFLIPHTELIVRRADTDHYLTRRTERGFMLDVGRKFVPLSTLEDYVRLMSWYKFNDFQLHFNDNALGGGDKPDWQHQYAAFRLDSPAFPGLAARDGSYTEQQIKELEQVASEHAVTITPEIDTPAHALALTQYHQNLVSKQYSREFLDLSNPSTTTFVNALWNTFLPWFSAPQVNMGMDEYDTRDADKYRQYINYYAAFLKKQGKTVRMWGSLSEMASSVQVNPDIVLEDWDNTWANSVDMAKQGFKIINADDNLLYIVPHANYYHDFLDTRLLYDKWEPYIFNVNIPSLNLQPGDPHILGGTFAVWNDKYTQVSVSDITARIEPAMPVVGEKMWTGPTPDTSYEQFEKMVGRVSLPPGTHLEV